MKRLKLTLSIIFVLILSAEVIVAQEVISPKDFAAKIKDKEELQLLDVRTPKEFGAGHVDQAKNINYYDLSFRSQVSKLDKAKPIYVYCQSGIRSAKATSILKSMGFKEIYDMQGGFGNWKKLGLTVVK